MKNIGMVARALALVLCGFCAAAATGSAQAPAGAITVDFVDPAFAGKPSGATVMNAPCVFGDSFHYSLTAQGELRLEGKAVCGSLTGIGGQHLCQLGPDLRCTGAALAYSVDERGVTAGSGPLRAWSDPQQAASLFAAIRERAEKKCQSVLSWQAIEKQHGREPSPRKASEQAECKPVLDKLCAAANGSPVTLASGRDITPLCR
jgi:hypothetical protein